MSSDWILTLAHWFGSAVCGQLPEHTYSLGGVPLPLCARCTGMYVGALSGLVFYSCRNPRSASLPRSWHAVFLPLSFSLWAADGVNSLLASFAGFPHLYPPENALRLASGALMGITLASLIFVLFNSVIWRDVNPAPILATPGELLALLGICTVLIALVISGWAELLLPLSLVSLVAILVLNSALMSAFAASLLRRPSRTRREARVPVLLGLAICLALLNGMAAFRVMLGAWAGVPL